MGWGHRDAGTSYDGIADVLRTIRSRVGNYWSVPGHRYAANKLARSLFGCCLCSMTSGTTLRAGSGDARRKFRMRYVYQILAFDADKRCIAHNRLHKDEVTKVRVLQRLVVIFWARKLIRQAKRFNGALTDRLAG